MDSRIKNRIVRTVILSALALVVGAGVGWYQVSIQKARVVTHDVEPAAGGARIAGLDLGGPFSLTTHTGEAVTEKNYAGDYKLLYFGFTYCPAICPTELQKISQVMRALDKNHPELASKVQPLFITVDPERDTVDVMREYVSLFHPRLVGLTGTQPQIDFVSKSYRVFATQVEDQTQSDYTVDHSSFIYLMGPEDQVLGLYKIKDNAEFIYKEIEALLLEQKTI